MFSPSSEASHTLFPLPGAHYHPCIYYWSYSYYIFRPLIRPALDLLIYTSLAAYLL